MESAENPLLSAALDRLWQQFLPQMEERVAVMESANRALAAGKLSEDQRAAANAAAHKLAGILGTFGLTKGTVLAREAEVIYAGDIGTDPHGGEKLENVALQLKTLIANRK